MDYFLHDQLIRLSNPFYDDEEIRDYKILLNMNIKKSLQFDLVLSYSFVKYLKVLSEEYFGI